MAPGKSDKGDSVRASVPVPVTSTASEKDTLKPGLKRARSRAKSMSVSTKFWLSVLGVFFGSRVALCFFCGLELGREVYRNVFGC